MPIIAITENTTVQNATVSSQFTGIADVAIRQENPDFSFNGDVGLALGNGAGENNIGLFSISGLSNIPAGATINSATLYINAGGGGFGSFDVTAHRSLRPFVITEATYNIYSAGNSWQTAGAFGALDKATATSAAITISPQQWYAIPVTAEVQALRDVSNDGLIVSPTTPDGDTGFRGFIRSTGTDNLRPELVVDYSISGGDTTPDQFTFTDVTGVRLSSLETSNTITITGIDSPAPISVVGGEYSINSGAFTSASGTGNINETVQVRGTSSTTPLGTQDVVLTIGGVTDTFTITTGDWVTITYDGTILNYTTTESFKELIENDHTDILVTNDIVYATNLTGVTYNSDTTADFPAGDGISGEYYYFHNSTTSPIYTFTKNDLTQTAFSGPQTISLAENTALSQVYTITNPVGATTLSGADAAQFGITDNGTSVTLTASPFNFESPADTGTDNVYDVSLVNNGVTYTVAVTVTDAVEVATFTINAISNVSLPENQAYTSVTPVLSGDTPIGDVTWSISGTDAGSFTVNASTGVVSLVSQDFENPSDSNSDNVFEVTLTATDADNNSASTSWTVTITDVAESAVFTVDAIADATVNEGLVYTSPTPTLSGATPIGSVTWSISGADSALFSVNASTGVVTLPAQDFEAPADSDLNNTYQVTLTATDEDANTASTSWVITIADVAENANLQPVLDAIAALQADIDALIISVAALETKAQADSRQALLIAEHDVTQTQITALNDFNPAVDTVARVTLVDTVTTNTDMRGTDNALLAANYTSPDNISITSILADTNELQLNQGNWLTATGFATPADITNSQTAVITEVNANETKIDSIVSVTAKLDTALELDGSVYRYTANSLELAPQSTGSGTIDNAAIASAVRSELSTELARVDVPISTRLAEVSYTAPDNAGIAANSTALSSLNDISVADIRTGLSTELSRIDATVSSRLPTSSYVTPPTTAEIEAALLNDGDGQALVDAIVQAIGNTNLDEVALVAAIRSDLERVGGTLASLPTLSEIEGSTVLSKTSDIAGLNDITAADVWSVATRTVTGGTIDTNLDMRGTDNALLAASYTAPDNPTLSSVQTSNANILSIVEAISKYHNNTSVYFAQDGVTPVTYENALALAHSLVTYDDDGVTVLKTVTFYDELNNNVPIINSTRAVTT